MCKESPIGPPLMDNSLALSQLLSPLRPVYVVGIVFLQRHFTVLQILSQVLMDYVKLR